MRHALTSPDTGRKPTDPPPPSTTRTEAVRLIADKIRARLPAGRRGLSPIAKACNGACVVVPCGGR